MSCSLFHLWLRGRFTNSAGSYFSPLFFSVASIKGPHVILHQAPVTAVYAISLMLYWSLREEFVSQSCLHWWKEEGPLLLKHLRGRKKRVKTHLKDAKRVGKALQGQSIDPLLGVLPVFHIEHHNFLWIVHFSLSLPLPLASLSFGLFRPLVP